MILNLHAEQQPQWRSCLKRWNADPIAARPQVVRVHHGAMGPNILGTFLYQIMSDCKEKQSLWSDSAPAIFIMLFCGYLFAVILTLLQKRYLGYYILYIRSAVMITLQK